MYRLTRAAIVPALLTLILSACGSSREATPVVVQKQRILEDPSVVAVVGAERITLQEFEREYAKSAGGRDKAADDSLAAYEDFLKRYVNFRLKVAEARNAGLETDSTILAEVQAYRNTIARPYMIEQEILGPIMQEIFERLQEVVSTSHILIQVAPNASPADTLLAFNRASALIDSLRGGADFTELARTYSEDPSAQNDEGPGSGGFLGFLPAGTLVPEYEDAAYSTPVGEVSHVFRTQFGYHILRVNDRQPAVPDIRVAHIMAVPGDPTNPNPKAFLDSLKALVDAGEDFGALARKYSMHQDSAPRDGDLGYFLSRYRDSGAPPAFVDAAFQLQQVGDVSSVVQSQYGYHLIQLLERQDLSNYDAMEAQLKQMASRSPRAIQAQRKYLEDIHTRYNLVVDTAFAYATLSVLEADSLVTVLQTKAFPDSTLDHAVIELGDTTYDLADFAEFASRVNRPLQGDTKQAVIGLLDAYITEVTANHATQTLEERNEEFSTMMKSFRDGLLLFRIMEDSVWNAASKDSTALLAYYEANASKYQYPERTRTIVFQSDDQGLLARVRDELASGRSVTEIQTAFASDSVQALRVDTTYVSGASNSVYDQVLALSAGAYTEPLETAGGYVVLLRDGQEPPRPKTFREAKPEVISAYQDILEARLLSRLEKEYDVQFYPDRLGHAYSRERGKPETSLTAK